MFPDPIQEGEFRTPIDGDCRNMINLNLLNVILGDIPG